MCTSILRISMIIINKTKKPQVLWQFIYIMCYCQDRTINTMISKPLHIFYNGKITQIIGLRSFAN